MKKFKQGISIIIKTLNEEEHIQKAIISCIKALKPFKGEIIIADSFSTDKTVEIAKRYKVKIIQLIRSSDKTCSVGAYIGFKEANYDLVYLLDGDMVLNPAFLKRAEKRLRNDSSLAGIGGKIENKSHSMLDKRYNKKIHKTKTGDVEYLEGGGLYKSEVIAQIGYLSNPNLHSYEEADLGLKIKNHGMNLLRLNEKAADHDSYIGNSISILTKKLLSGYMLGTGEVLRYNLFSISFFRFINMFKIYLGVIVWWVLFSASFYYGILKQYLFITMIALILLMIKKQSIVDLFVSLYSWNITAVSLIIGFVKPIKTISRKIEYKIYDQ